jgi:acyl transferase domain-containing protein/NAD(P)H-dependent flavin oxidoreductase YrpB (nitropropane dioxygenase family)/NAD(P)-dependent dehydrogenase (short-subunit alcohol dehydrogenase family)
LLQQIKGFNFIGIAVSADFISFVYSPSVLLGAELAIAATRSGGVGVINAELERIENNIFYCLDSMEKNAKGKYGLKLGELNIDIKKLDPYLKSNLAWLIIDSHNADQYLSKVKAKTFIECTGGNFPDSFKKADGIIIKGNESGGYVGEESSFILLQKWAKQTDLPLYVRGGMTPHVAAACAAMGVAGGVFDSQVLLLEDSPLAPCLQKLLAPLSGSETVAVGDGEKGDYFRILSRPQLKAAKQFTEDGEGKPIDELKALVTSTGVSWLAPQDGLLPVGHDVCFAEAYRKKYGNVARLIKAVNTAVSTYAEKTLANPPLIENSQLAQSLGIKFPIIQGPMTRVSDTAEFANSVAEGGALPMLAFALMKGEQVTKLLEQAKKLLAEKPWGIGLLGFVPPALLEEQINAALPFKPNYAIIAGGRPDQAVALEAQGIPSFLHLPSANLLANFLKGGARRFIFEGRECGGHIGPLSSFVLWSTMIDRLLVGLDECGVDGSEVQCIFAGGIHDEYSSALLQVMISPLIQKNVKVGIIMGSAYLFTKEIVESGAIVDQFQKVVVECQHTVNLESGPGHASRCAYTPFAANFFKTRKEYKSTIPIDQVREKLDDLIMGTLRMASKGVMRKGEEGELVAVNDNDQKQGGMYMLGQVVPLRREVTTIAKLHAQVTGGAKRLLDDKCNNFAKDESQVRNARPADIAIIGMSCALPGAKNAKEYWQNILDKVDSVTEVPKHRWDWRLYFDEDRHAKDKVYSKWGGFIDDMVFDPMKYGITPKSIESVDPMQLMALEVASAALEDAGFDMNDAVLRARTSVIVGASGGAGDVGMQYGLRSELPRFVGQLPENIANNLPQWSEDTFAGILINVVPGRIANRLNLGGVNYTTDAACASSLSAIYQAVSELQNGTSDVVIAGGADTVQGPFGYMCFSQTQALSPTGRCRTFDESSDGIVISEGIVMLVLKRLEDAERDGDRIYSVIKGVGGGSDGKAKGLSAPLPEGQLRAMERAYEQAGFSPNTIGMFEAHGTGTVAGDTAELQSTSSLIKNSGGLPRQAVVGSVKTMIGHTKATAGVAGLMKASLALYHKVLPPHGVVNNPNHVLSDKNSSLYLLDKAEPWLASGQNPRRAATSAFGFGGTNFHVVMEEYTSEYRCWKQSAASDKWTAELFLWSGKDKAEINAKLAQTQNLLAQNPDIYLRDLAFTLAKSYNANAETIAIVAESFSGLNADITAVLNDEMPKSAYHSGNKSGKLAVLFSGQGSQYTGMLSDIAVAFPIVSETLSEADKVLATAFELRFGKSLSSFIFPRGAYDKDSKKLAEEQLKNTDVAQPSLGAVEAALWQLMQNFSLKADKFAGHSYGEFVAMYAAGKIDFADLMQVSESRGRLIVDKAAGDELGTMAAVKSARADVESAIQDIADVVIANHNAPEQIIISGSKEAIAKASEILANAGKSVVQIPVAAAFHSPYVKLAQSDLAKVIDSLNWQEGDGIVYSNNTAKPHDNNIAKIKVAMAEHLVASVEFVKQIEQMYEDGARVFLELGPKNVLTKLVGQILGGKPHTAIAFDDKGRGITGMLHAFSGLLCAGVSLDVNALFTGRDCIDASSERTPEIPKHAWLLNGSGARRVGEPVKQIGVTLETATSAVNLTKTKKQENAVGLRRNITNNRRTTYMRNHDEGDNSITRAYFDLVARQLDNARDVALAELGVSLDSALPRQVAAPAPRPRNIAPMPQAISMPQRAATTPAPVAAKAPTLSVVKTAEQEQGKIDIKQIILKIVTEKTGYEADMIEFNQNLEADLGVDSIKRVDIVSAILETLPAVAKSLGDNGKTKLSTAITLEKMLQILTDAGETPVNFNFAEVRANMTNENIRHLPRLIESRYEMTAVPEALIGAKNLTKGDFIITGNNEVAKNLAKLITEQGCNVRAITDLQDENVLNDRLAALEIESLAGVVHLAPLGGQNGDWQQQIFTNEKSLFLILKHFSSQLKEDAHVLAASQLGGLFARRQNLPLPAGEGWGEGGLALQGGAVGLIKSLCKEQVKIYGKAVDLDSAITSNIQAKQIFDELVYGGRIEVGYPKGVRTIFKTVTTNTDNAPAIIEKNLIVLATGGARGVTAEVLRELAVPGNTLILTGRSPLPTEDKALRDNSAATEQELAKYFAKTESLTLGEARKKANSVLAAREMLDNIADFQNSGAVVEYHAVDVADEKSMSELLSAIYKKYKKIDGVVHGAGIIEDKYLADITSESWSRVVDTKVMGLLYLQKYLQADTLKFLTVFSSVAGRYGNSGQSNYATANELMNRICCQLQAKWQNVKVSALCWGPWGKTKFGAGMVNAATEAKFAKQGVYLVHAELGRELFRKQFSANDGVEIICGQAPWEEQEAAIAKVKGQDLMINPEIENLAKGEIRIKFSINKNQPYLQDHIIEGNPVLPMAVAMEMMSRAVLQTWGNQVVTGITNAQLFKGVMVNKEEYPLIISMVQTSHGMDGNNTVKVKIISADEKPVPHYGATINIASGFVAFADEKPQANWQTVRNITAEDAYNKHLFHGVSFQVIKSINSFSSQGIKCVVKTTSQDDLLKTDSEEKWSIDPAVTDAAAQLGVIWMSVAYDVMALPVKFERVEKFVQQLPERLTMEFIVTSEKADSLTANIYCLDSNGEVVLLIEGMQHIVSQNVRIKKAAA